MILKITFDILEIQEWSAEYIFETSCLSPLTPSSLGVLDRVS